MTDIIKQLALEIRALKAKDISDSDVISMLEFRQENLHTNEYKWFVKTRTVTAFGFVLDDPSHGILDTSTLNDNTYTAYTIQQSGGTF